MSARDELAALIAKTNTAMGRPAGAFSRVTPEEMLRLWRSNSQFRSLVGPAADALLARYDAEERVAEERRQAEYTVKGGSYWGDFNINDILDDLIKDAEQSRTYREYYQQQWSEHLADAFVYGSSSQFGQRQRYEQGNPFARSAPPPRPQPQDPERTAALAQARKIKALADDHRGNEHQRDVARRKLAELRSKHGLTYAELIA